MLDDAIRPLGNISSLAKIITVNLVNAVVASCGFIVHFAEGLEAMLNTRDAYRDYADKKENVQAKTRLVTGALSAGLAGAGAGLSVCLLLVTTGAIGASAVLGVGLMPFLIPACLTAIYGLALYRKAYIFHRAKDLERIAEEEYKQAGESAAQKYKELNEKFNPLHSQLEQIKNELDKLDNKTILTPEAEERKKALIENKNVLMQQQQELIKQHVPFEAKYAAAKQKYEYAREKRLRAEAHVAFGAIEVAGSILVGVSVLLGVSLIMGLGVISGGAVPLALAAVGVGIAFSAKVFEQQDEKKHHAYTRKIRSFFTRSKEVEKMPLLLMCMLQVLITIPFMNQQPRLLPSCLAV